MSVLQSALGFEAAAERLVFVVFARDLCINVVADHCPHEPKAAQAKCLLTRASTAVERAALRLACPSIRSVSSGTTPSGMS